MHPWNLKVRFWGVRGSVPTPTRRNMSYGGNTTCLELSLPTGEVIILDAGTGITEMGAKEAQDQTLHIFFTHLHWDHLQGLPFFPPLYDPGASIRLYSSNYCGELRHGLESQMRRPYFPVDFHHAASDRKFVDIGIDSVTIGNTTITPFPVHHPNGAAAYRIEAGESVLVFAPDRECGDARLDDVFEKYAQGADLLVHDAMYTAGELQQRRGWGHSTWEETLEVAQHTHAHQVALFHHDPSHDDQFMAHMELQAKERFEGAFAAREGVTITL